MTSSDPKTWQFQPDHPAWRLDGCAVAAGADGRLEIRADRAGRSLAVLTARAPLRVAGQGGASVALRPGWDGTLGYAHYGLEIVTTGPGTGWAQLELEPVHAGEPQDPAALAARPSRFPDDGVAFRQWQAEYRQRLAARLMNGGLPASVPPAAEVLASDERQEFSLRRVRYRSQADRTNTLLLSLPRCAQGPAPLLVALHGHEAGWGEADAGAFAAGHADDFCAHFAARGWAVLQPATMNHSLQHRGWTLQGEWTWDAMAALGYASGLPEIDASRVAVCGLSTGAHLAMNLLALDDRVQAGVVGCILSTWHHYRERLRFPPGCDCGILGQLGDWLEPCDWAVLAAPKPVQFQHGRQDACFCPGADPALLKPEWFTAVMPVAEFDAAWAELSRGYRMAGAAGRASLYIHEQTHRVDPAAALAHITTALNGAFPARLKT